MPRGLEKAEYIIFVNHKQYHTIYIDKKYKINENEMLRKQSFIFYSALKWLFL